LTRDESDPLDGGMTARIERINVLDGAINPRVAGMNPSITATNPLIEGARQ
jgi:hypothetical protein